MVGTANAALSRPAWARGLKHRYHVFNGMSTKSRPAWARGLKLLLWLVLLMLLVAPRVGAWIETPASVSSPFIIRVAPRVGAWIETKENNSPVEGSTVAPRVGAWIETLSPFFTLLLKLSRPAWARGLKRKKIIRQLKDQRRAPRGRVD